MIDVVILRGCGEQVGNRDSLLWWVATRLDPKRFRITECAYPASIGPVNPDGSAGGMSLERSGEVAYPMLDDMIQATHNEVILLGYSQGAWTASRFLERRKHGLHPKCSVPWAVLFANPLRPAGVSHDVQGAPGFGVAGVRERIPGVQIREVAHPEDGITSCPWDSRLRTVADLVDPLSFALGGGWFQGLAEKTMRGDWQQVLTSWRPGMPLPDPGQFALRYWRDAKLVDGYLRTGKHGASYWTDGLLQRAVDYINAEVR